MNGNETMTNREYGKEIVDSKRPECGKPTVRHTVNLSKDREVWKCRDCCLETEYVDEMQFIVPPPIDGARLIRFMRQAQRVFRSNIVQIIGSWQDGCAVTMHLTKSTPLAGILIKVGGMSDIESTQERPLVEEGQLDIVQRAVALPVLKSNHTKTIFVTLSNR